MLQLGRSSISTGARHRAGASGEPGTPRGVQVSCACSLPLPLFRFYFLLRLFNMNPISQFFILSPRGDTIVTREFRGDVPKGAAETFFRKARAGLLPRLRAAPPVARRRRRTQPFALPPPPFAQVKFWRGDPPPVFCVRARVALARHSFVRVRSRLPCGHARLARRRRPSALACTRRSTASTMWRSRSRRCI